MKILGSALLALVLSACAAQQHPVDNNPVGLGAWCEEVTATLCHALATRCNANKAGFEAGCQVASRESCVGGRERSLAAGRTGEELRVCIKQIDHLDCTALNASAGALTNACSAKVAPAPVAATQP